MIRDIRLKVCGLTSLADVEFAHRCGADYLGFIFYPQSPRYLSLAQYAAIAPQVPAGKRVAVMVTPVLDELSAALRAGFDYFQIHFPSDTQRATIEAWSKRVGPDRLWLAPKLPPLTGVDPAFLPLARCFLLDTFQTEGFGGSGKTGDWKKFARHRVAHPEHQWILSGGLNPDNIAEALRQSGARFVDVNSGVESAPGVKDRSKLQQFVARLQAGL